ncbi:MAG: type II toxin-antitoxin system VapC family toxin [Bryobacteraceae bacterium]
MPPFVVDASMTLSWRFVDKATPYSRAVLAALQTTYAVVPAVWPFEIANGLAIAERRNRINQDQIAEFLETLRRLPIQVERREAVWRCQAILRLAREHQVTACDAAYRNLAKRQQLSSATLDHDLQAAGLSLRVATLDF